MYFGKFSVLALAAFAAAFPCDNSQRLADVHPAKGYFTNHRSMNGLHNLPVSGNTHPDDHCDASTHLRLGPRKTREEEKIEKYLTEWRDVTWPPEERKHWPSPVLADFEDIIMPHLDPKIELRLPSPLLPTNNEVLKDEIYTPAARKAERAEITLTSEKRLQLEKLKRAAKSLVIASRCWHVRDCKIYKQSSLDLKWSEIGGAVFMGPIGPLAWIARTLVEGKTAAKWRDGLAADTFGEMVYWPLVDEVRSLTQEEAFVNLGKQLKELGFEAEDSYY
ncbi:hypothetical protein V8E51_001903 [Hyaloscypha variabilis]|jgi:hypothetical protein|uniref:Uncharacterized protein n=1 Tax=Hyaloscypha variabilis (strain UAMH 11265 / GT02V1 / F) TaxID=1149755 RepID=A0A2J6R9V2_HYAVF|nr:hypothetical protein L207DRAFT_637678 [Hyaloscypha variabilis F]